MKQQGMLLLLLLLDMPGHTSLATSSVPSPHWLCSDNNGSSRS
jgi:hypothetical protein